MNEADHATPQGRKEDERRWSMRLNLAVLAIFLSMLSIVAVGAYSVVQGHTERTRLCEAQNATRATMRAILADALAFNLARGRDDEKTIRVYFDRQIARVQPVDCASLNEGVGIHVQVP